MTEFDLQWAKLPSPHTEYNVERVDELLSLTRLEPTFFKDARCLDVGCGNGRYTYAMQQLGAKVASFDKSPQAVDECRRVNPNTFVFDLYELPPDRRYDFVLCYGVLHHCPDPYRGFVKVASQVKPKGTLFTMVYNCRSQVIYEYGRKLWPSLSYEEQIALCKDMIAQYGGTIHGWWDSLNPEYNWSFTPKEVRKWFNMHNFGKITLTKRHPINMRGVMSDK